LIDIICNDLQNDAYFQENTGTHKLIITGQEKSPTEISCGVVIQRHDIATTHEEADSIIVQAIKVAVNEQKDVITIFLQMIQTSYFTITCKKAYNH